PVITGMPASAKSRAVSTAASEWGSSGRVRAELKIDTTPLTHARLYNPHTHSPRIRSARHESDALCSAMACCGGGLSSSASSSVSLESRRGRGDPGCRGSLFTTSEAPPKHRDHQERCRNRGKRERAQ